MVKITMITIRPFTSEDYDQWLPLWDANNDGRRRDDVTAQTWARLNDEHSPVHGLGAFDGDTLIGLVHYIIHPTTGNIDDVCYMQDVFTNPSHRKKGIARALIAELERIAHEQGWNRIYWMAEADNIPAQNLYKTLGVKLDFTLHVLPVTMFKN